MFNDTTSFVQSTRYSQMDVNLRQMYSYVYAADVPGLGPLLDPLNERKSILRAVQKRALLMLSILITA